MSQFDPEPWARAAWESDLPTAEVPATKKSHRCSDPRAGSLKLDAQGRCVWCGEVPATNDPTDWVDPMPHIGTTTGARYATSDLRGEGRVPMRHPRSTENEYTLHRPRTRAEYDEWLDLVKPAEVPADEGTPYTPETSEIREQYWVASGDPRRDSHDEPSSERRTR